MKSFSHASAYVKAININLNTENWILRFSHFPPYMILSVCVSGFKFTFPSHHFNRKMQILTRKMEHTEQHKQRFI